MESDSGENRRIMHGLPCLNMEEVFMSILERLLEDEISRACFRLHLKSHALVGLLITTFREKATEDGKKVVDVPGAMG